MVQSRAHKPCALVQDVVIETHTNVSLFINGQLFSAAQPTNKQLGCCKDRLTFAVIKCAFIRIAVTGGHLINIVRIHVCL